MESILITQEKKNELETELLHLKTVLRPAIGDRLMAARALGDLSENAEYQVSRDEQGKNEGRIQEIEHILKYATIIKRSGSGKIELGAKVVIKKDGETEEKTFQLVSEAESDIAENKISPSSLIGSAMMGKSAGDSFVVTTPRGETKYTVVSVE